MARDHLFSNALGRIRIRPQRVVHRTVGVGTSTLVLTRGRPSNYTRPDGTSGLVARQVVGDYRFVSLHILSRVIVKHKRCISFTRHN